MMKSQSFLVSGMRSLLCSTTYRISQLYFGEGFKIWIQPTCTNILQEKEFQTYVRYRQYLALKLYLLCVYFICLLCKGPLKDNFLNYCKMVEKLPPLNKIMRLMQLARFVHPIKIEQIPHFSDSFDWKILSSNPTEVKTDTRDALGLKSFPSSTNSLPRTSYIPLCFFDKVL